MRGGKKIKLHRGGWLFMASRNPIKSQLKAQKVEVRRVVLALQVTPGVLPQCFLQI